MALIAGSRPGGAAARAPCAPWPAPLTSGVGRRLRRPSTLSSHRISESSRKSSASVDEQQAELVVAGVVLEPGVLLHQLDQLPAVDLEEGAEVDVGEVQGDEHLDDELVAGRRRHVRRGAQPGLELVGPGGGQREGALRAGAVVVGVDEPVALEPLQGRVHLPDVERPHLAGAVLELLAELQPVLRALAAAGRGGRGGRSSTGRGSVSSILSIILTEMIGATSDLQ